MPLYSFNGAGHNAFTEALGRLREIDKPTPKDIAFVKTLAMNPAFTELADKKVDLPSGPFPTRFELCSNLFDALEDSVAMDRLTPGDGIWSWLSAYYFEELTNSTSKNGKVKLSVSTEQEFPAYIWNANFKKAYRHRIGHGVFMIRHLGKELSKPMLLSAPGSMSDYCEQTFARVGSYREKTVIEAAHSIYFDGKQVIPGSSGERRWALQHLHRDVGQYLVNYELHEMRPDELLEFLPPSFKKQGFINWRAQAKVVAAFIATYDGIWKDLLGEETAGDPIELFAEQIGCTDNDLSKMIKEASAKLDVGRKGPASGQHWAVEFETLIRKRRIAPENLATSVKKLLGASDPEGFGDELLDELIDLMEG
jgi:hypothetical protein